MLKYFLSIAPVVLIVFLGSRFNPEPKPFHAHTFVVQDTFDQKKALADLRKQIEGKENDPSNEVYENIEMFGKMPAGRLLRVMEMGFSRSLGVDCTHCHNPKDWGSEEKHQKQITRDMMAMTQKITQELLPEIENLESETPTINCTTCHRGDVIPATNLGN
jgi:hypothetical protein